jgi:hypothetical protein
MSEKQLRKIVAVAILTLIIGIVSSVLQPIAASANSTASNTIFKEDFESYPLGEFGNSTNWEVYTTWYANPNDQKIVDTASISGTKSLQVMSTNEQGQANGIIVRRALSKSDNLVGFEVFVMLLGDGLLDFQLAGDWSTEGGIGWASQSSASFRYKSIKAGDTSNWIFTNTYEDGKYDWFDLQTYDAGRWYRIDSIIDTSTLQFKIWIDGQLKGVFNEHPNRISYPIDSFILSCDFGEKAYVDDITVFEGFSEPIPEFSTLLILPLLITSTLLAVIVFRRKLSQSK